MRYQSIIALLLAQLLASQAYGSVSEVEPNSPVTGITFQETDPLHRYIVTTPSPDSPSDPSLAKPLPLNDELVGQLSGPRDYDWFYVDIADTSHPVTPVYFGCDKKLGFYYEAPSGTTVNETDAAYRINYYYQDPASGATELQSSYLVYPVSCKRGDAETKGPLRFQMNTEKPGRYFVRVWGNLVESGKDVTDQITVAGPPDENGNPTTEDKTRHNYYDVIISPTADYTLRLYTARVTGEMEPNDGMVEAFVLASGKSVPGQLSSMYDQDWFAIDNDATVNTSNKIPFFFSCKGQTGSSYFLSAYDALGVQQVSYEISADQCSGASGFSFTINAPITARYYFVVNSPTYTDTAQFTQSDYTVLAITQPDTGSATEVPTRLPGELEPNDTEINAYPLTDAQAVTAQLSSASDLDFYYYDNDSRTNNSGVVPIYFRCGTSNPGAIYQISYFNAQGVLQKAYSVATDQCSVPGGFRFDMVARSTARYFILVAADAENFSNDDYTLSTFFNAAAEVPGNVEGRLRTAQIVDSRAANRDKFTFTITQCGNRTGVIRLSGNRLNLPGVDPNTTVQVQIGPWACSATAELSMNVSNPRRTVGVYPPPAPASTPTPTPTPTPTKKVTGLAGGG